MRRRFVIRLTAALRSPLHISGPGERLPLVDRCVQVDHKGLPIIPASTLRGRARAYLERLLRSRGHPVCTPPRPELTCPHNREVASALGEGRFCLACRVFGSSWRPSTVYFSDLKPRPSDLIPNPWTRTGIGISRYTGAVREERLFSLQLVPPFSIRGGPLKLSGRVEGELEEEELGWLIAALRAIRHIGGGKARGMGAVEISIDSLTFIEKGAEVEGDWRGMILKAVGGGR